ncbi:MAG: hypothetical protein EZS28_047960, partial [Streblomastix strix]
GIEGKEVADNQHTDELQLEDISQKVGPRTSKSSRVSGMEDRLRTGSIINDRSQIEENDSNVRIMEKDCAEQAVCEGEVPGKLHRFVKLLENVDQTRRTPSEETKQDQGLGCANKTMELIYVAQHVGHERDILVENNYSEEQANLSQLNLNTSDLSNRCVQNQLGSYSENVTPRLGDPVSREVEQQLAPHKQQSERSSRYFLRTSAFRDLLKRKADQISKDRNGQQFCGYLPSQKLYYSCWFQDRLFNQYLPSEVRQYVDYLLLLFLQFLQILVKKDDVVVVEHDANLYDLSDEFDNWAKCFVKDKRSMLHSKTQNFIEKILLVEGEAQECLQVVGQI